MSQRRKFSAQYKDEAVQLVIQSGRPVAVVARELGINEGTLGNWVNPWMQDHPKQEKPLTVVERARLREIEDDNRRPVTSLSPKSHDHLHIHAFFARTQP